MVRGPMWGGRDIQEAEQGSGYRWLVRAHYVICRAEPGLCGALPGNLQGSYQGGPQGADRRPYRRADGEEG